MARKRCEPEEIVVKLHQVDVLTSQGASVSNAIRQIGVSEAGPDLTRDKLILREAGKEAR